MINIPPLSNSLLPLGFVSKSSATQSKIWKNLKKAAELFYETPALAGGLVITGLALSILFPAIAPPFFATATSLVLTRLAVKILAGYNLGFIEYLKKKAYEIHAKYPKVQMIVFIFALVISGISPIASCITAIALGIFSGIIMGIEHCQRLQKIHRHELANPNHAPKALLSLN